MRWQGGILRRTTNDDGSPRNKVYREKGIKCRIGESVAEVQTYLTNRFGKEITALIAEGKTPSIDRIDSNRHYEEDNLRIIEWKENGKLGLVNAKTVNQKPIRATFSSGEVKEYESISAASKAIGCKRDTIYAALERPGINRRGIHFEEVS